MCQTACADQPVSNNLYQNQLSGPKILELQSPTLIIMLLTTIRSNKNIKVFIADDSLIVREHLVTMLAELPHTVIVGQAENVVKAINGIREFQPDVVILDIRMPGGSGIDVLQAIKQDEPASMVIMLTNYPYPGYRQKCLQVGADFFLDKSTEFDQIPELLARYKQDQDSKFSMQAAELEPSPIGVLE